ncbi:hypothetical protein J2W55_004828 [Mucilaginibacter pocheonensis]|uniref:Uncharacterized protein n=1 Tax=Mucilaginibacter pocheonensis TaxID=398050 RepID=A0ABU1TIB7_9SPHI|nr:hypothetical protein [Mucilaginibacter pocheonensis]
MLNILHSAKSIRYAERSKASSSIESGEEDPSYLRMTDLCVILSFRFLSGFITTRDMFANHIITAGGETTHNKLYILLLLLGALKVS